MRPWQGIVCVVKRFRVCAAVVVIEQGRFRTAFRWAPDGLLPEPVSHALDLCNLRARAHSWARCVLLGRAQHCRPHMHFLPQQSAWLCTEMTLGEVGHVAH